MKKNGMIFKIIGIIYSILGIIILIIGIIQFNNFKKEEATFEHVMAEISRIERTGSGDDVDHDVYLNYEFKGKEYTDVHVNFYSTGMYEGDEIEVFINPDDSKDIIYGDGAYFAYIAMIMGLIFAAVGIPILIIPAILNKKNEKLVETGKKVYGVIEEIVFNTSVTVNGRNPYVVYCKYEDPTSGMIYKFKSKNLYFNPHDSYKVGDNIGIYLNPENYKKYYVEVVDKMAERTIDYT